MHIIVYLLSLFISVLQEWIDISSTEMFGLYITNIGWCFGEVRLGTLHYTSHTAIRPSHSESSGKWNRNCSRIYTSCVCKHRYGWWADRTWDRPGCLDILRRFRSSWLGSLSVSLCHSHFPVSQNITMLRWNNLRYAYVTYYSKYNDVIHKIHDFWIKFTSQCKPQKHVQYTGLHVTKFHCWALKHEWCQQGHTLQGLGLGWQGQGQTFRS